MNEKEDKPDVVNSMLDHMSKLYEISHQLALGCGVVSSKSVSEKDGIIKGTMLCYCLNDIDFKFNVDESRKDQPELRKYKFDFVCPKCNSKAVAFYYNHRWYDDTMYFYFPEHIEYR